MIPGALIGMGLGSRFESRVRAIALGFNAIGYLPDIAGISAYGRRIVSCSRSYNVATFKANGDLIAGASFDVYGDPNNATAMANYLNTIAAGTLVIVSSWDEPDTNHTSNGLPAALERCGASATYAANTLTYRSAYLLIGKAGIGAGKGYEYYKGDASSATNSLIDVSVTIRNGAYQDLTVNRIG